MVQRIHPQEERALDVTLGRKTMKHDYGYSGKMGMSHSKKSVGGREMSNVKKSEGKQVSAGRGTIRTPFNRAVIRNVGSRR